MTLNCYLLITHLSVKINIYYVEYVELQYRENSIPKLFNIIILNNIIYIFITMYIIILICMCMDELD